jgi:hypothetical protein
MIQKRLESGMYRRVDAMLWDVRLMASNTLAYNRAASSIAKCGQWIESALTRVAEGKFLGGWDSLLGGLPPALVS